MPRTEPKPRTFPTRIDLPAEKREALVAMLNQSLADIFDLFSQTKQAHWNVKGKDFYQLHELFDEIAAEAVRALLRRSTQPESSPMFSKIAPTLRPAGSTRSA